MTRKFSPEPSDSEPCDPEPCDIAIIGGGLAGSALAIRLARAGRRVTLFERDRFPRDKLCGEFLSPESRDLLRELGCLRAVLEQGAVPIRRARFSSIRGRVLELSLPGEGLGISRAVLDELLFRQATASGARTFEGSEVKRTREGSAEDSGWIELEVGQRRESGDLHTMSVRARCAVGAYGRHSRLDRDQGGASAREPPSPVAFKKHHRPASGPRGEKLRRELAAAVEIHATRGGYCGLAFVENDTVNVCMLLRKEFIISLPSSRWPHVRDALGSDNPVLAERLAALVPVAGDRLLTVGQIPIRSKEPVRGHVLYVGDAAGMIAPLCGDGQAMALSSAKLLAELIERLPVDFGSEQREELVRAWTRSWRQNYARRMWLGRCLQRLLLRPRIAHHALGVLGCCPALAQGLMRWTRGS